MLLPEQVAFQNDPVLIIYKTGSSRGETGNTISVNLLNLYRKGHSIVGCNSLGASLKEMKEFMVKLREGFESGELEPPSSHGWTTIGLDGVVDAYRSMAEGRKEKFLIEMQ